MIGLKVSINGGEPLVCGGADLGVLMASVQLLGRLGPDARQARPGEPPDLYARVGGLTSRDGEQDEHVTWIPHGELAIGDRVTIEIIETDSPSDPVSRRPARERT